ncbi:hypothetical protein V8C86DRAFT_2692872 [Haematococcus lacustris]
MLESLPSGEWYRCLLDGQQASGSGGGGRKGRGGRAPSWGLNTRVLPPWGQAMLGVRALKRARVMLQATRFWAGACRHFWKYLAYSPLRVSSPGPNAWHVLSASYGSSPQGRDCTIGAIALAALLPASAASHVCCEPAILLTAATAGPGGVAGKPSPSLILCHCLAGLAGAGGVLAAGTFPWSASCKWAAASSLAAARRPCCPSAADPVSMAASAAAMVAAESVGECSRCSMALSREGRSVSEPEMMKLVTKLSTAGEA